MCNRRVCVCVCPPDEMRALDAEARAAGVPVLCEMGLDPGMDHLSAMAVIDEVRTVPHIRTSSLYH